MKTLKMYAKHTLTLAMMVAMLAGCKNSDPCKFEIDAGPNAQTEMQDAMNQVEDGCRIELGDGVFELTNTLNMDDKSDVAIVGRSRDNTILSFAGQSSGGDGMLITNSENIVIKDLTIRDAGGDALKFHNSNRLVMYRVATEWSGVPSADNGAYGFYPVLSSNILIENCYAYGASDAGIYVGQSDRAIVRNSTAVGNVAGIQIENTTNADVYNNIAMDNAAGILVFDLPGLSQSGSGTRVYDNSVLENIRGNFASGGSIVTEVPAGTGILVLSTRDVEVFNNRISKNNVLGTAVASYAALVELGIFPMPADPNYNLYPAAINIHNNVYDKDGEYPPSDQQSDFGNFLVQSFGSSPIPDIILDGIFLPGSEPSGNICVQNNTGSSFVNLNLPNDFPNNLIFDSSPQNCSMASLPPVDINIPEYK